MPQCRRTIADRAGRWWCSFVLGWVVSFDSWRSYFRKRQHWYRCVSLQWSACKLAVLANCTSTIMLTFILTKNVELTPLFYVYSYLSTRNCTFASSSQFVQKTFSCQTFCFDRPILHTYYRFVASVLFQVVQRKAMWTSQQLELMYATGFIQRKLILPLVERTTDQALSSALGILVVRSVMS